MPDLKNAGMMLRTSRRDLSALGGMLPVQRTPRLDEVDEIDRMDFEGSRQFLDLVDLTDFAVIFRYGEIELDAGIDRSAVLAQVARLVEHVEGILRAAE